MTAERWNKIKALFSSAQDCPVDARDDFLSRACRGDKELRNEIEKLLDSYNEEDAFLQNSAVAEVASLFERAGTAGFGLTTSQSISDRLEAGTLLSGRYEIVRLLGKGGMGEVYLANDTRIKRTVALKMLHSDLGSSKDSLRRFALEAQAVSALNHPHIMTIYEFDTTDDGTRFFVAEYVNGLTLNHSVRAKLDLSKALDIAMQISSALSAAHEAGITHRDIKPENIMVRPDGFIKVLDFGLAKLHRHQTATTGSDSEDPTQALLGTKSGMVMGTAAYMSPEQARGVHVDERADIWSLGVVLFEMITGKRPFVGETQADLLVQVLSHDPQPMASYGLDLPAELEWIVSKALTKDVEGRYQTSKELRADLEKVKKQIEFDESLSRSTGGVSRVERNAEEGIIDELRAIPTSGDPPRPTDGANDDSSAPLSFWSSRSFSGVLQQAQTNRVRSSIVSLILLALVSSGVYFGFVAMRTNARIDSIAVLPFENLSGDPDLAYVSNGLSENVIDRLSELPQLKVISRNSSFRFRGADLDLRNIASQLGVQAILTGSVSQVGDDLVIRFDLVDAVNDRQITGGEYRRKNGNILRIQNEIAQATAEQLRLKLTDSQTERLARNGTENSDAFRYYLSGLVELNSGPQDIQNKALEYFEQAIKLDPNFAAAYTEIAWIYWYQANGNDNPHELMPKVKSAAERALTLDPNLAKAHVLRAMVSENEFDWPGAEKEYLRALELSPNLNDAHNSYALFLSVMGRSDEALAELEQQGSRDPLNRRRNLLWQGAILTGAKRFDDALKTYQEAKAVEPDKEIQPIALGYTFAGKGLYREAAGYYKKAADLFGGEEKYSQPLIYLAATYAKIPEKRVEARAILAKIEAAKTYVSPALLAAVYSALDENDKAMALLERAYIERDLLLRYVGTGYEYDGLRADPRFVDLLKRIGLGK